MPTGTWIHMVAAIGLAWSVGCTGPAAVDPTSLSDCTASHVHRDCRKGEQPRCLCDSAGHLRRAEIDWDGDGRPDLVRQFDVDAQGRVVRDLSDGQTAGKQQRPDGTWDRIEHFEVDASGRTAVRYDLDGDGSIDRRCTYSPPCVPSKDGTPCAGPQCE